MPNTGNTGPGPGDTNSTAETQTGVVEVYGTPADGSVPAWNATTGRFEWSAPTGTYEPLLRSGTAAARPSAVTFGNGFYFATDTTTLSHSDGSAWTTISTG
jgi:hypothetical protein